MMNQHEPTIVVGWTENSGNHGLNIQELGKQNLDHHDSYSQWILVRGKQNLDHHDSYSQWILVRGYSPFSDKTMFVSLYSNFLDLS